MIKSALDLILDPPPDVKKSACGKSTLITLYTNRTVGVRMYQCHRWDCPTCGPARKQIIMDDLEATSPRWYTVLIDDVDYDRVRKKIKRAGAGYCAIGRGESVLLLTDRPVFEDCVVLGGDQLREQVNHFIDTCGYFYRRRRIRHSQGLFPPKPQPPEDVHISRRLTVKEKPRAIVAKLQANNFDVKNSYAGACYLRHSNSASDLEGIIFDAIGADTILSVDTFSRPT